MTNPLAEVFHKVGNTMQKLQLKQAPTVAELAALVSAQVVGDNSLRIFGISALDAPNTGHIAFTKETRAARLGKILASTKLQALIVKDRAEIAGLECTFIVVADPLAALIKLIPTFYAPWPTAGGISKLAAVDPSAKIAADAQIGDFVSVGKDSEVGNGSILYPHVVLYPNVKIGKNCTIHAHAVIREDCVIGDNVVIHSGVIIGSDGFGYIPDPTIGLVAVPQVGTVTIGNRVEIGANTCIDRATFGATSVGDGTKIDNQVQIGHNCSIGRNTVICGQVGLAGSSNLGDGVVLGGSVGVADHIKIASGARVAGKSAVFADIEHKGDFAGNPAVPLGEWSRQNKALHDLPKTLKILKKG